MSDYLTRMQVALLNCESDNTEFVELSPTTVREVVFWVAYWWNIVGVG